MESSTRINGVQWTTSVEKNEDDTHEVIMSMYLSPDTIHPVIDLKFDVKSIDVVDFILANWETSRKEYYTQGITIRKYRDDFSFDMRDDRGSCSIVSIPREIVEIPFKYLEKTLKIDS